MKCPTCNGTGEVDSQSVPFGVIVAARRVELGLTQKELAEKVGTLRTTIANIETGRHVVKIHMIRRFAEALQLKPEELLP